MLHLLTTGTLLGLTAGIAPGPLLALVISETLQHNLKSGVRVALAPIITDLPIVLFAVFLVSNFSRFNNILGIISIFGGFFILYLGYKNILINNVNIDFQDVSPNSLKKGIIVNALSPHPYLFWFSVGAPIINQAVNEGVFAVISFIASFYGLLVGSKIVLAIAVGKSRSFLMGNTYIYTMRLLGILLLFFAGFLFRDGLTLLGVL